MYGCDVGKEFVECRVSECSEWSSLSNILHLAAWSVSDGSVDVPGVICASPWLTCFSRWTAASLFCKEFLEKIRQLLRRRDFLLVCWRGARHLQSFLPCTSHQPVFLGESLCCPKNDITYFEHLAELKITMCAFFSFFANGWKRSGCVFWSDTSFH